MVVAKSDFMGVGCSKAGEVRFPSAGNGPVDWANGSNFFEFAISRSEGMLAALLQKIT
jgi:hypothetical protein